MSWTIKVSDVKPGIPDWVGCGRAEVEFISEKGTVVKGKDETIKIPILPQVRISTVNVVITPSQVGENLFKLAYATSGYGEAEISLSLYLSRLSNPIKIVDIQLLANGLNITKISPSIPYTLLPGESVDFSITLQLTSRQGFDGPVTITLVVQEISY